MTVSRPIYHRKKKLKFVTCAKLNCNTTFGSSKLISLINFIENDYETYNDPKYSKNEFQNIQITVQINISNHRIKMDQLLRY